MTEPNPHGSQTVEEERPVYLAILNAWVDTFRPRSGLLLKTYVELFASVQPNVAPPQTLDEARERYLDMNPELPLEAQPELATIVLTNIEGRMVSLTRALAAWITFWTAILPAMILVVLGISEVVNTPERPLQNSLVLFSLAGPFFFVVLFLAGLFIQTILMNPFIWLVNRLVNSMYEFKVPEKRE